MALAYRLIFVLFVYGEYTLCILGIKCSHAGHTFTHRLMAAIHSGHRYPYSCVAMGMSVIPKDYHLL